MPHTRGFRYLSAGGRGHRHQSASWLANKLGSHGCNVIAIVEFDNVWKMTAMSVFKAIVTKTRRKCSKARTEKSMRYPGTYLIINNQILPTFLRSNTNLAATQQPDFGNNLFAFATVDNLLWKSRDGQPAVFLLGQQRPSLPIARRRSLLAKDPVTFHATVMPPTGDVPILKKQAQFMAHGTFIIAIHQEKRTTIKGAILFIT